MWQHWSWPALCAWQILIRWLISGGTRLLSCCLKSKSMLLARHKVMDSVISQETTPLYGGGGGGLPPVCQNHAAGKAWCDLFRKYRLRYKSLPLCIVRFPNMDHLMLWSLMVHIRSTGRQKHLYLERAIGRFFKVQTSQPRITLSFLPRAAGCILHGICTLWLPLLGKDKKKKTKPATLPGYPKNEIRRTEWIFQLRFFNIQTALWNSISLLSTWAAV